MVALIEPAVLFTPFSDTPSDWTLLSDPDAVLLRSGTNPSAPPISEAAWTLMVSQRTGIVQMPGGNSICFARVQIPGMPPMLLIHPVHASVAAGWIAAILSLLGLGVMLPLVWRGKPETTVESAAPAAEADVDAAGYRQIVQSIADPICVVDGSGAVLKANRAAHEWLHLQRGRPDDAVTVSSADSERSAHQFLKLAGEDPAAVSGAFRMSFQESVWEGVVEASRLYRDGEGRGPVLLHFRAQAAVKRESPADESIESMPQLPAPAVESGADPRSPFPVLCVTPDGLIVAYNEAARRACVRLEDTPLLGDVLPGMDGRHFADVLAGGDGSVFQSLFGPRTHEFTVVFYGEQILLYGHPLADSQNLEIEMKQAQENFYGLCALVPSPVLLVDPREHTVIEANAAAGDLFERTAAGLRGQTLDSLSAEPWEPARSNGSFVAQTSNGDRVPCMLRYELIKVEGVPLLMVVLDRLPESVQPAAEEAALMVVEPERPLLPAAPPALPIGPGMLITLNPTVREVARRLFDKCGHSCEAFTNLDDAVVWIITHDVRPEFLAVDLTDFDVAESWISDLRARCGDVPCIAFTDGETYSLPAGGLNAFLEKPFDLDALQDALSAVDLPVPAAATA
jgi:PAS domain-containing protein